MKRLIQVSILLLMSSISYTQTTSTITDPRDGQSYKIVKIGDQWWMAENLRASIYNNGDPIPNVTDNTVWDNLTSSAYCWYDNNESTYKNPYGALYNWYAVNNARLCPVGWHVPTDEEWTILTTFLGGEIDAGGKLKEAGTDHWTNPNDGATNEVGFSALPGGYRTPNFSFGNIGLAGYWWSSSEDENSWGFSRSMGYDISFVSRNWGLKTIGTSVRCVKSEFVQGVPGQIIDKSITLTQDIGPSSGPGLIIAGSNVTVDGEGYKILGNGTDDGVILDNVNQVKVINLFVSGFEKGIVIKSGNANEVVANEVHDNNIGVSLFNGATRSSVKHNIIRDNQIGISSLSEGNNIFYNIIFGNNTQIQDGGGNLWTNLTENVGNFWSNYWGNDDGSNNRVKGDFIGDTDLPHEGVDYAPLLDPSIPEKFGSYLCADWWLYYRGGWSPVNIQLTDHSGKAISKELNQIGLNAFYAEDNQHSPGHKLVQILVHRPCPGTNPEGIYSFQMTGLDALTYSLDWGVSERGVRKLYYSVKNVPLKASEVRKVDTDIQESVSPGGVINVIPSRIVDIDIKPGDNINSINNKAKGVIPVAIMGRADFDVKTIDPGTVKLEGLPVNIPGGSNKLQSHYEDVNKDGYVDLVVQIDGGNRNFKVGSTIATLIGNLKSAYGGWKIDGQDNICFVSPQGNKEISSIQDENYTLETQFELFQNYPNPFTNFTTILFVLPEDSKVVIEVYDIMGKKVTTLINENLSSGYHKVEFESKNLKEGTYTYRISSGKYQCAKNMIHIRE